MIKCECPDNEIAFIWGVHCSRNNEVCPDDDRCEWCEEDGMEPRWVSVSWIYEDGEPAPAPPYCPHCGTKLNADGTRELGSVAWWDHKQFEILRDHACEIPNLSSEEFWRAVVKTIGAQRKREDGCAVGVMNNKHNDDVTAKEIDSVACKDHEAMDAVREYAIDLTDCQEMVGSDWVSDDITARWVARVSYTSIYACSDDPADAILAAAKEIDKK